MVPGDASADSSTSVPFSSAPQSPFPQVARRVQPSVVSISVSKPRGYEYDRGRRRRSPATVSYGSGIILGTDGHILTNNHVVDAATRIQVVLSSGQEYAAKIIGQDSDSDLALIRVFSNTPLDSSRVARIGNSDHIRVGDWVMAFGSPFGYHKTVSVGVISAKGRHLTHFEGEGPLPHQAFLQTDASINPGNSGGPLVDLSGRVVGINTAYNPGGSGIGFAIPVNLAARVVSDLRQYGRVVRGYLGIHPQELTPDIAEALGLDDTRGVLVGEVEPKGPADRAGMQQSDVILKLEDTSVNHTSDFFKYVSHLRPQEQIRLTVFRFGEICVLSVRVGHRPPRLEQVVPSGFERDGGEWPGLEIENRWAIEGQRLGVSRFEQGVVVTYAIPGGPADQKGIGRGDLILKINTLVLEDVQDYQRALAKLGQGTRPLLFLIQQKDQDHPRFVALRPLSNN